MEPSRPQPDGLTGAPSPEVIAGGQSSRPVEGEPVSGKGSPPPTGWRRRFVVGIAIVALLCIGGTTAAFLFYDKATRPDLRTPVLVTEQYLTAYLGDRDDARAGQFQCGDASGLYDVRALRAQIDAREKASGTTFAVSVDSIRELGRTGDSASVAVDLAISSTVQGQSRRELEHWEFSTRDDSGWRVCSGHEVT